MRTTAEMRARLLEHSKRASHTPWYVVPEDGGLFSVARADQSVSQWLARSLRYDNAVLIAESANMVPDLLADMDELIQFAGAGHWDRADALLAQAQKLVEEMRANNDDSRYRLLESAHKQIVGARADIDADQK